MIGLRHQDTDVPPDHLLGVIAEYLFRRRVEAFDDAGIVDGNDTVDDVIEWAQQKGQSGEAQLRPAWVNIDGVYQVVMPGSPFYPEEVDS